MQGPFTGQLGFIDEGWQVVTPGFNGPEPPIMLQPIITYGRQVIKAGWETPMDPMCPTPGGFEQDWRMIGMQQMQYEQWPQIHQMQGMGVVVNPQLTSPMMPRNDRADQRQRDRSRDERAPKPQKPQRQEPPKQSQDVQYPNMADLRLQQKKQSTDGKWAPPNPTEQNLWDHIKNVLNEQIWQVRPHRQSALKPKPTNNWFEDTRQANASRLIAPQKNNLKQFIDQQVSFLQPSPIEKKLNQLRNNGQKFIDEVFPPNQQSLTGEWGYIEKWKNVKWRPISEIIKKPVIFQGKVEPKDIKQGQLGDCYFLAALAALAERPERIFNLFLVLEENAQKYYACKILYKGKWKTIDMDEYIPTLGNSPAFSKAVGQQLWVILLEKAWAKLYSSYKRIESGYGEEGIHNLTGAHMHAIRFQAKDFDKQKQWQYLMRSTRYGYCMIASSQPGSDTNKAASGIVLGHAYTIIGAYQLQYMGRLVRLIKLRNPWGKGQSVISWCDKDPRWNSVTTEQKRRVGFDGDPTDGIFFQAYDDFIKDFRILNVAEVNDQASYVYSVQHPPKGKGCYFKVNIFKEGSYSFQLNQTPDRAYEDRFQKKYKYRPTTLLIGRVQGKHIEYFEGSQSAYRTLFKKHKLPPGEYIVFAKIFFDEKFEMDYEVTLAIYGDYVCQVMTCPPKECAGFKEKLFFNRARRGKNQEVRTGVWTAQEVLRQGYIYFACWNRSQDVMGLRLHVQQNPNPSVTLKKPYKGLKTIEVQVHPKQDLIILARVKDYSHPTSGIGSAEMVRLKR